MAVLVAALALGLTGCIVRRASEGGDRTESREVSDFDTVDFSGFGKVEVVQGDEYALELSGPTDLVDRIETEVHGSTLYIGRKPGWELWFWGFGDRSVDMVITVPELKQLRVAGAGEITIDGLSGESFEFDLSGAGSLKGSDLDLSELVIDMSGAGSAVLSGKADDQEIVISGAGEYDGKELESRTARIDMSGAGSAQVWATESLDIVAAGAGGVDYWGNPDVRQEVSGAGTVNDRGDK